MRKQPKGFLEIQASNFNQWETTPRSSSWIKDLHRGVRIKQGTVRSLGARLAEVATTKPHGAYVAFTHGFLKVHS